MSVFKRDRDPYRSSTSVSPPTRTPSTSAAASSAAPVQKETSPARPEPTAPEPRSSAESDAPRRAAPSLARDSAAVIDKNSELSGTLHSNGNVLIEGAFKGEIQAKETVLVEREARTEAKLCANEVIVSGSFDGEIDCQHRLQITATASIRGEIVTPVLVVEDGSTVDCRFKMSRGTGR